MATARGYIGQVLAANCQPVKVSKKNNSPKVVRIPPGTKSPGFLFVKK